MINPFDVVDAPFLVLVNEDQQYSLWPSFAEVPAGWSVANGEADRANCMKFIEDTWTDMRPASLRG
jgi:uncharacterized protein YbdZ (MbtH family)